MTTKRQMEKAAKLWALSIVWHSAEGGLDEQGDEYEGSQDMREAAGRWAERELDKMGFRAQDLLTDADCLRAAKP